MNEGNQNKIIPKIIEHKPKSEKFVSWQESLELSKKLWEKYKEEIFANYEKDVDNLGEMWIPQYQKSTDIFLDKIPEEIQEHYWGHGVTRGDDFEVVASVLNIMANKFMKGDSAPLAGVGAYGPWTSADFFVISKADKPLYLEGSENDIRGEDGRTKATKVDIGAIVVDVKYYPMVEELRQMYPDVNIIKANQIPEYFGVQMDKEE